MNASFTRWTAVSLHHPSYERRILRILLVTPYTGEVAARNSDLAAASAEALAGSAASGWRIDEFLVAAAGGNSLRPVVVEPTLGIAGERILRRVASSDPPRRSPLRCFTIKFWRQVRPDLLPVFVHEPWAENYCGPFLPSTLSSDLWRYSVLAALDALAGGRAVITPSEPKDKQAAARIVECIDSVESTSRARLDHSSPLDEIESTLATLAGRHEEFPSVVASGAVAAAGAMLAGEVDPERVVGMLKIYWRNASKVYSEAESFEMQVTLGRQMQRLRIPVPTGARSEIRLDPLNRECQLYFAAIRLTTGSEVLHSYPVGDQLLLNHDHSGLVLHPDDSQILVAVDDDPHFLLELPPSISASGERYLELDVAAAPRPTASRGNGQLWPAAEPDEWAALGEAFPDLICDLSTWQQSGFQQVGSWSLPEHDDPSLVSGPLRSQVGKQATIRMAAGPGTGAAGALYLAGDDGVFSEAQTLYFDLRTDGELHDYVLDIPDRIGTLARSQVKQMRLDPVDGQNQFRLHSLEFDQRTAFAPVATGVLQQPIVEAIEHRPVVVSMARKDYLTAMGGTERRITDEANYAARHRLAFLHVHPAVRHMSFGGMRPISLTARLGDRTFPRLTASDVAETIRGLPITEFRLHQISGWGWQDIGAILTAQDAPVRYYAHDYFAICPAYQLLRNDRTYCGAPPSDSMSCLVCTRHDERLRTRPRVEALLAAVADRLTIHCPSEVTADLYAREFPRLADRIQVHAHERLAAADGEPSPALPARMRLAFVGIADDSKGWSTWMRLREDPRIAERYELVHLGLNGSHSTDRHVRVDFRVNGTHAMEKALRQEGIHVALIWSNWPETFSFVTVEAIAAGCAVLTSEVSGNVARLVEDHRAGAVLRDEDALIELLLAEEVIVNLVRGVRQVTWKRELNTDPLRFAVEGGRQA